MCFRQLYGNVLRATVPIMPNHLRVVMIVTAAAFAGCGPSIGNPKQFDSEQWKQSIEDRAEMLDDLRSSHLQAGLLEQDVLKLLGEPDDRLATKQLARPYLDSKPYQDSTGYLEYDLDFDDYPRAYETAVFRVFLSEENAVLGSDVLSL